MSILETLCRELVVTTLQVEITKIQLNVNDSCRSLNKLAETLNNEGLLFTCKQKAVDELITQVTSLIENQDQLNKLSDSLELLKK